MMNIHFLSSPTLPENTSLEPRPFWHSAGTEASATSARPQSEARQLTTGPAVKSTQILVTSQRWTISLQPPTGLLQAPPITPLSARWSPKKSRIDSARMPIDSRCKSTTCSFRTVSMTSQSSRSRLASSAKIGSRRSQYRLFR
ncbi:uncharacterized protein LOC118478410, partial [Aplysia californica]|uniref:Uncharacterized protein LOC118478410 n=1 Tax=Aplysia californica TaxID=6500 RepID=A0ABM1VZM2_APLCA